ncbi:hypothetical protein TRFO_41850 [Tritrichomonas foetus]|uniref:Uncharacterized protein n=1 Tax=Tritrichomonas foetus TaxID=1144522 RepID=A0A1J4KYK3_9EUKA|nr:hypothetical protein TRFO_41850 [Tritrichomonas foetus]|eukprot:OHT16339.1 hypothetical protein TRFO_41850 [Tritrichomonas foetus]
MSEENTHNNQAETNESQIEDSAIEEALKEASSPASLEEEFKKLGEDTMIKEVSEALAATEAGDAENKENTEENPHEEPSNEKSIEDNLSNQNNPEPEQQPEPEPEQQPEPEPEPEQQPEPEQEQEVSAEEPPKVILIRPDRENDEDENENKIELVNNIHHPQDAPPPPPPPERLNVIQRVQKWYQKLVENNGEAETKKALMQYLRHVGVFVAGSFLVSTGAQFIGGLQ